MEKGDKKYLKFDFKKMGMDPESMTQELSKPAFNNANITFTLPFRLFPFTSLSTFSLHIWPGFNWVTKVFHNVAPAYIYTWISASLYIILYPDWSMTVEIQMVDSWYKQVGCH